MQLALVPFALLPYNAPSLVLQVSRDKLAHLGTCIGKLTHTGKFRLTIACLDLLAQHAKYKVSEKAALPVSVS